MTTPARRPWYTKKRWAAAALSLVVAYPAGLGPVGYGIGRGWVSRSMADLYVAPIVGVLGPPGATAAGRDLWTYARWWIDLGERHAAAD